MNRIIKVLGIVLRITIAGAMILWTFTMNVIGFLIGIITE